MRNLLRALALLFLPLLLIAIPALIAGMLIGAARWGWEWGQSIVEETFP